VQTITRINKLLDETGSVSDPKKQGRSGTVGTEQNQTVVAEELATSTHKSNSQRRLSAKLGIKRSSLQNIMRDMNLYPYRPRLIHSLNEDDFDRRVEFAEKWLQRLQDDPSSEQHVVWSARSPDITPTDLFLWGHLKNKVY
jgi:hypothetical protein